MLLKFQQEASKRLVAGKTRRLNTLPSLIYLMVPSNAMKRNQHSISKKPLLPVGNGEQAVP